MTTSPSRRDVLALAAAGATVLSLPELLLAAEAPKAIPIALQLYSVRQECQTDLDAVLEQAAKMGFTGVEFFNNSYFKYNNRAADLRKRLDDLGLKSEGIHANTAALRGDALKAAIDTAKILGTTFIIVPMDNDATHPERSKAFAEVFNQAAEVLKPAGMACGYHNHQNEFRKDGDKTFFELFAERTSKDVVLQQDVGWTVAAGFDPVAMMKKYPGRFRTTHFKPYAARGEAGKKDFIGQDSVDWPAVIKACREVGGTEWFVVEQETYPDRLPPMDCTRTSMEGLQKILRQVDPPV
jgi:sugar phosphate isomerase/epimerase